jgi:hypothetical protein
VRILLCGPDGAGKSTIAERLLPLLNRPEHVHFRRQLRHRPPLQMAITPGTEAARSSWTGVTKVLAYFAGSWAAELSRPGLRRDLLVERGWHDQAVDPARYRLDRRARSVAVLLGRFVPRYDVAVLCEGDETSIHARKPELSVSELRRQLALWRIMAPRIARRVVHVDTVDQSPSDAVQLAVQAILAQRWRRPLVQPRTRSLFFVTGAERGLLTALYEPRDFTARAMVALSYRLGRFAPRPSDADLLRLSLLVADVPSLSLHGSISSSFPGRLVAVGRDGGRFPVFVKHATGEDVGIGVEHKYADRLADTGHVPDVLHHSSTPHALLVTRSVNMPTSSSPLETAVSAVCFLAGQGLTHGDLTPWNIRGNGDNVMLLDLETMSEPHRPFHDLATFVVRAGARGRLYAVGDMVRCLIDLDPAIRTYACMVDFVDWQRGLSDELGRMAWEYEDERQYSAAVAAALTVVDREST